MIRPTRLTRIAVVFSIAAVAFTLAFLLAQYEALPFVLPVHFRPNGRPNGWQFKTPARVLTPVFLQMALVLVFGSIAALLLSRRDAAGDGLQPEPATAERDGDGGAADIRAASTAAEGIALIMTIWVSFQAYAAFALAGMWQRQFGDLGRSYVLVEACGLLVTIAAAIRTHVRLGRPDTRPFVAAHWRFGHLYKNPEDPALFVPTRDGSRWTLNFGRPVAAALMAVILMVGLVAPTAILVAMLR